MLTRLWYYINTGYETPASTGGNGIMAHYHIAINVPGYLPEGEPYTVSSLRAARAPPADEARRYREGEWDLPRKDRRTASGSARDGYIHFERPNDSYDLGVAISWTKCWADSCRDEQD